MDPSLLPSFSLPLTLFSPSPPPPLDSEVPHSKRQTWTEVEGVPSSEAPPFPIYQSPQRQLALQLCGWSFAMAGHSLEDFIKRWIGSECMSEWNGIK